LAARILGTILERIRKGIMISRQPVSILFLSVALSFGSTHLAGQATDSPIVNPAAGAKFAPIPNAPKCFTVAVEKGDPTNGPSVILARFAPHCDAPYHWHTPSETAMVASGRLETQMKGDKPIVARSGDFVYLPSHHVHRATCNGTSPCLVFLSSDAAFDVHWVDAEGKEIPLEQAVKPTKVTAKPNPRLTCYLENC
jgi:quercetin dioxygenase-like cupin family protein